MTKQEMMNEVQRVVDLLNAKYVTMGGRWIANEPFHESNGPLIGRLSHPSSSFYILIDRAVVGKFRYSAYCADIPGVAECSYTDDDPIKALEPLIQQLANLVDTTTAALRSLTPECD